MTNTGEVWRLGHRPALDGLRGVAVLLVVAGHIALRTVSAPVGVALFFALSGYLITGLLLSEARHPRLRRFYLRRVLRLAPALVVVLVAAPVVLLIAWDSYLLAYPREALAVAFYVRNFTDSPRDGVLPHAWSLSVEEQFYLVWPVVLLWLVRCCRGVNRRLLLAICGLAACATVWRLVVCLTLAGPHIYSRPDTNAFALLAGAALVCTEAAGVRLAPRRHRWAWVALACLAAVPVVSTAAIMWAVTAAGLLAVFLLLGADGSNWLAHPVLRWFGKLSYGWYLWHYLLMSVYVHGHAPGIGQRVVAAVLSLGIAWASHRYVERPFLRLKDRRSVGAVEPLQQEPDEALVLPR